MNEVPILCIHCGGPIKPIEDDLGDYYAKAGYGNWLHTKTRSPYCYNSTIATPPEES